MLQKVKHIFPLLLAVLFLYPLVYQSIHVFEHHHETHCCGSCSGPAESAPGNSSDDTGLQIAQQEEDCSVCNFHYAKLQVSSSLVFSSLTGSHELPELHHYPKPFVLFQGYIFSLRAPPLG